jgi:hypothetical protein
MVDIRLAFTMESRCDTVQDQSTFRAVGSMRIVVRHCVLSEDDDHIKSPFVK